jgi:hypothetical protein
VATGTVPLRRRALGLEYFTIGWNVVEAVVAVWAGLAAGSIALVGFGLDACEVVRTAFHPMGIIERSRDQGWTVLRRSYDLPPRP